MTVRGQGPEATGIVVMFERIKSELIRCAGRIFGRRVRRLARQEDGSAAVEFALVATPFLALLFAILETAFIFFASQTLEAAVADSGRLIMTGQAQTSGWTAATFKNQVCARIFGLFDCTNGVYVNVQKYSSFGAATVTTPYTNGEFDPTKTGYNAGDPGEIQVVQLFYRWPVYLSLLSNNLANQSGSKRLLVATSVFRNEPFK